MFFIVSPRSGRLTFRIRFVHTVVQVTRRATLSFHCADCSCFVSKIYFIFFSNYNFLQCRIFSFYDEGQIYWKLYILTRNVWCLRFTPNQCDIHEHQKYHAANVKVQIKSLRVKSKTNLLIKCDSVEYIVKSATVVYLVEWRWNICRDDLSHWKCNAHNNEQFAVQRRECCRQCITPLCGLQKNCWNIKYECYIIALYLRSNLGRACYVNSFRWPGWASWNHRKYGMMMMMMRRWVVE